MDALDKNWCCFTCGTKFRLGEVKLINSINIPCPRCNGHNTHPADGNVIDLEEYHDEIGTRN